MGYLKLNYSIVTAQPQPQPQPQPQHNKKVGWDTVITIKNLSIYWKSGFRPDDPCTKFLANQPNYFCPELIKKNGEIIWPIGSYLTCCLKVKTDLFFRWNFLVIWENRVLIFKTFVILFRLIFFFYNQSLGIHSRFRKKSCKIDKLNKIWQNCEKANEWNRTWSNVTDRLGQEECSGHPSDNMRKYWTDVQKSIKYHLFSNWWFFFVFN